MTRVIAVAAGKALSAPQVAMLSARSRNVLTTGDCPVYKLFLRRTLALLRHTLVEGGMPEDRFVEALRKVGFMYSFISRGPYRHKVFGKPILGLPVA